MKTLKEAKAEKDKRDQEHSIERGELLADLSEKKGISKKSKNTILQAKKKAENFK